MFPGGKHHTLQKGTTSENSEDGRGEVWFVPKSLINLLSLGKL